MNTRKKALRVLLLVGVPPLAILVGFAVWQRLDRVGAGSAWDAVSRVVLNSPAMATSEAPPQTTRIFFLDEALRTNTAAGTGVRLAMTGKAFGVGAARERRSALDDEHDARLRTFVRVEDLAGGEPIAFSLTIGREGAHSVIGVWPDESQCTGDAPGYRVTLDAEAARTVPDVVIDDRGQRDAATGHAWVERYLVSLPLVASVDLVSQGGRAYAAVVLSEAVAVESLLDSPPVLVIEGEPVAACVEPVTDCRDARRTVLRDAPPREGMATVFDPVTDQEMTKTLIFWLLNPVPPGDRIAVHFPATGRGPRGASFGESAARVGIARSVAHEPDGTVAYSFDAAARRHPEAAQPAAPSRTTWRYQGR